MTLTQIVHFLIFNLTSVVVIVLVPLIAYLVAKAKFRKGRIRTAKVAGVVLLAGSSFIVVLYLVAFGLGLGVFNLVIAAAWAYTFVPHGWKFARLKPA